MKALGESLRVSTNKRIFVTRALLSFKVLQLILLILFRRVILLLVYVGQ